jgi:glycosyltransferase involved in cell wall biosynthesis
MKGARTRLMMTADAVGGVWTYAAELLRELAKRGYQTRLVTIGPRASVDQREMIAGIPALSVIETGLQLEWQDPEGIDVEHAARVLNTIALQFEPDVVHLNSFREAAFDWPCPMVVVAHSCVNTWSHAVGSVVQGDDWRTYTQSVRKGLDEADAWVAPSAAFGEAVRTSYGVMRKGRTIRNGLAHGLWPSACKKPLILGAGRVWDPAKNLATLAAAAENTNWPVFIAGPLHEKRGMDAQPPSGARYLGTLPRVAVLDRMRSAEIFCSPALYEPFGLSVLEAAAAGCALVLSNITTFRELWDGAAMFVDPDNPGALAAALNDLCSNDEMRRHLQDAASLRARRYSIASTADAYHALYSSLRRHADSDRSVELSA